MRRELSHVGADPGVNQRVDGDAEGVQCTEALEDSLVVSACLQDGLVPKDVLDDDHSLCRAQQAGSVGAAGIHGEQPCHKRKYSPRDP